jgi:hypothetical protein
MHYRYTFTLTILLLLCCSAGFSQSLLNKHVSVSVTRKPLGDILKLISRQGNFYFSYNSNTVTEETLITLNIKDKPVKHVLNQLFDNNYEFKETESHIIIQYQSGAFWYATGYIKDGVTGDNIAFASVYDKNQFVSTMTNETGYFKLKLKDRNTPATLYVSKSWYNDTMIVVNPNTTKEISVNIIPQPIQLDSVVITQRNSVERNWFSRTFLSSKQRMQSLNLGKYFVDKPYQSSLIPGFGTHGRMGAQVINKFSFNVLGGYTAGVNGFELGGLFNIVKKDVKYVEIGGLFNIVGGSVNGLQIAGVYNQVLKASNGWQFSGVCNFVNNDLTGLQVAGVYNHVWGNTKGVIASGVANLSKGDVKGVQVSGEMNYCHNLEGVQATGVINIASGKADGVQVAGVANITRKEMKGTQAGVLNYAGSLKGVQVGLINVADTSSGLAIGLLNFVWKGYHKFHLSTDEVSNLRFSGKIGSRTLYNIVTIGLNVGSFQKAVVVGYGLGSDIKLYKRFSLSPEITGNYVYTGDTSTANWLCKLNININYNIFKWLSINAGPSYNFYYSNQTYFPAEYKKDVPNNGTLYAELGNDWYSWLGWHAGISIF